MDDIYEKKICKGMCLQADDLGLCMGICGTDNTYAQAVYDKFKSRAVSQGKPWEPIADFEQKQPKPEQNIPVTNVNADRVRR